MSSTNLGAQGPRIYGLGAMQMYTPLSTAAGSGTQSEFYLAQIEAIHAGKSMQIELWDPGDTGNLTANVQILMPTAAGWTPVNFSYSGKTGTSNGNVNSSCNTNANANTNAVTTSTGASLGVFNGCWLTIIVKIPADYTAPDPGGVGAGWWKIRYNMSGTGHLERRHDLEGLPHRQPGPPRPAVGRAGRPGATIARHVRAIQPAAAGLGAVRDLRGRAARGRPGAALQRGADR